MATLYTQTTQSTSSNFNDGTVANARYAWQFVPTTTGTPTNIKLYCQGIVGTATGEIYIKADKTLASTTYGSATALTFATGENSIALSSGAQITASTTYWVFFVRTTASTAYPQFQYDTAKTTYHAWRPSASNIDPDTDWFTFDIKMTIDGTAVSASNNLTLLGVS
jgi:hypothetical protein